MDSNPSINDQAEKITRALDKFVDMDDQSASLYIILRRESHQKTGDVFFAEGELHARQTDLHAEGQAETPIAALDALRDEIASELRSRKKKHGSKLRRGGRMIKDFVRGLYKIN